MSDSSTDMVNLRGELAAANQRLAELLAAAERHRQAEASLSASERQYRTTVDAIVEAIHVVDRDLRIVLANQTFRQWCGRFGLARELVGLHVQEAFPFLPERVLREYESVFSSGEVMITEEVTRVGELEVVTETRKIPILEQGAVQRVVTVLYDITDVSRAGEALHRSEERFRALVETTSDWVWETDADGVYTYASPRVRDLLGYEPEDVVGRTPFDLMPPEEAARVAGVFWEKVRAREPVVSIRNTNLHRDERVVVLETNATPVLDDYGALVGYRGSDRDITARQQAEVGLKRSISLLRATLDSTGDGILVVNSAGAIDDYNRRFVQMWSIPESLMAARDDQKAVDYVLQQLKDPAAFLAKVRQLYAEPEAESFDVLEFTDGRVFERYSQPQRLDGRPVGRVWSFRDVTRQRQAVRERLDLEAQVQQAQRLESLGVLAGGIAHDFNNLLTVILGHAGLALGDLPPESPARSSLWQIETASRRAAELCRQMLAYSGKCPILLEPLNVTRLVQETTHMLQVSVSKKAVLHYRFDEGLPDIEADPGQVRQVVMNLVINASEAIGDQEGQIVLTTGCRHYDEAELRRSRAAEPPPPGRYVYIEVTDTGCGMDLATANRIFDPFFTTKFAGRGLGLAAVLGILRTHRGAIMVDSAPGQGTTITAIFPALDRPPVASPAGTTAPTPWQGSGTLLLVDDEEPIREVAARMLERCGFSVLLAADGAEAVRVFQEHADDIVGVLLDLTMPRLDGMQTLRELRRLRRGVPVLLASGYSEQEIAPRLTGLEPTGFIQKPYQTATVRAKLQQMLG